MTLHLLVTHRPPPEVAAMLKVWSAVASPEALFVAYGGPAASFGAIAHPHKALIDSPSLKTSDHQREKQSYASILSAASSWLKDRDFAYVHLAEYDQLPLVPDLDARQAAFLKAERANVLGFRLRRVDDTHYANYLYHAADPRFFPYWQSLSTRHDCRTVLRMTGTGSFWTRAAFDAVAARPEPFPIYLEIYLPTLAHHLGFRVRDWGEQNRFIHHLGDFTDEIETARKAGAWSLHPVKSYWERAAQARMGL